MLMRDCEGPGLCPEATDTRHCGGSGEEGISMSDEDVIVGDCDSLLGDLSSKPDVLFLLDNGLFFSFSIRVEGRLLGVVETLLGDWELVDSGRSSHSTLL